MLRLRCCLALGGLGGPSALYSPSLATFAPIPRLYETSRSGWLLGNSLYVVGGQTGVGDATTIERATISTDGSLSAFVIVSGVTPATPRAYHMATVMGNSIYVLGGDVDILNSVEHASLR